jgi:hypothetical protein
MVYLLVADTFDIDNSSTQVLCAYQDPEVAAVEAARLNDLSAKWGQAQTRAAIEDCRAEVGGDWDPGLSCVGSKTFPDFTVQAVALR